jgi:hypothetical protein
MCLIKRPSSSRSRKGVRSRANIRFIPLAVGEFGTLGGRATAFFIELARYTNASKAVHVGKLLAS